MRIAIAGASGFVGKALTTHLRAKGHEVLRLVRSRKSGAPDEASWDPHKGELDPASLDGTDAIVNLSGENLATRWTQERKKELRTSRLAATGTLCAAMAKMKRKPSAFISSSAIGYYGQDRGAEELTEASSPGSDFLAMLCQEWEAASRPAADVGVRVVNTRSGIILNPEGGVLEKLLPPFKLGAGGKVGSGDQWVSWISLSDQVAAVLFAIENAGLSGAVNFTGPNPVTNEELAKELGKALHRPAVAPVPAAIVRLALGREMADATVLASQRVLPKRLTAAGFQFAHPNLGEALRHELGIAPV